MKRALSRSAPPPPRRHAGLAVAPEVAGQDAEVRRDGSDDVAVSPSGNGAVRCGLRRKTGQRSEQAQGHFVRRRRLALQRRQSASHGSRGEKVSIQARGRVSCLQTIVVPETQSCENLRAGARKALLAGRSKGRDCIDRGTQERLGQRARLEQPEREREFRSVPRARHVQDFANRREGDSAG